MASVLSAPAGSDCGYSPSARQGRAKRRVALLSRFERLLTPSHVHEYPGARVVIASILGVAPSPDARAHRREMAHARRHAAAAGRPRRFNDIKRNTAGISQPMLTRTLRGLESDGIVTRKILPTSPPQVEYSLTQLGRSMSELVLALGEWIRAHLVEFDAARHRFDKRNEKVELSQL